MSKYKWKKIKVVIRNAIQDIFGSEERFHKKEEKAFIRDTTKEIMSYPIKNRINVLRAINDIVLISTKKEMNDLEEKLDIYKKVFINHKKIERNVNEILEDKP